MNIIDYPFDSDEILRKKKTLKRQLIAQNNLPEKRIAILSGSTIGDIKDILELFLLNFGIKPQFYTGNHNRFYEDIAFDNQELAAFRPELIYIHTSVRNLADTRIWDKLSHAWAKARENYACPIIQNNFELPGYGVASDCRAVNEMNIKMVDYAKENRDFYINDIQHLSARFGIDKWFNEQEYFLYKYAFSVKAIPLFCHQAAKIIKSVYGKNQKCLVLDLDNTLWGGVVGDVGVPGLELGMKSASGEAFSAFQSYIKTLHTQGVILAVCSKNEDSVAREAFKNPDMILHPDDFSAFYANWNNKAANILNIAEHLNILPESMVFVDDNPAERELVRRALPEVNVPEGNTGIDFIRFIEGAGYFYTTHLSDDDSRRNAYYASNARRTDSQRNFIDYGDYLLSLQMHSRIAPFVSEHLDRITQLINKTNQFNLTTRRYSFSEIERIAADARFTTLYATLDDKFGSNGIVSALIGETVGRDMHIRLWVMSCRVFKRDLELAVCDRLVEICRNTGLDKLLGYYFRTDKNGIVSGLFHNLGFTGVTDTTWELDLSGEFHRRNKYIQVTCEETCIATEAVTDPRQPARGHKGETPWTQ